MPQSVEMQDDPRLSEIVLLLFQILVLNLPLFISFVRPNYLALFDGRFIHKDVDAKRIIRAARAISNSQLRRLLKTREYRGRFAAAWYIGLTRRSQFVDQIAELLREGDLFHEGQGDWRMAQGYCVALGLIGGQKCENLLRVYLTEYLPTVGRRYYDQLWAVAALAHIQGAPPQEFLDPNLWKGVPTGRMEEVNQKFQNLVRFLREHRMIS
jgi:hypothetical protein